MKKMSVGIVTLSLLLSSLFQAYPVSAQTRPPGWDLPIAQVGPGGESVAPIGDIVRRDTALLRSELREARENGGDVLAVLQAGITRLIQNIEEALGMG